MRSIITPLIGIQRILGAVLTPMPLVKVASLNILHHSNHHKQTLYHNRYLSLPPASKLGYIEWIPFFASRTFREALIVSVSFPDVKGALPPTVTAAFVDAASTL